MSFPFKQETPQGRLEIYNERGLNRDGYAAYLYEPNHLVPRVGIGPSPDIAVADMFSTREKYA